MGVVFAFRISPLLTVSAAPEPKPLPALVVAGEVKSAGRIPQAAEIVAWMQAAQAKE